MRGLWLGALAACAMLGVAHAQTETMQAPATPTLLIYEDELSPGWSNWSWAEVELSFAISDPEERPIAVRADGWEALYLQHAPFSTAGYRAIAFYAHGGARGGQRLHVQAIDANGAALPNQYVPVTLAANAWTEVVMPLDAIGAADQTVSGFWIQNGTGETAARFFVNMIVLR